MKNLGLKSILLFVITFFFNIHAQIGNVGINTASPTETLNINGTLRIRKVPVKGSFGVSTLQFEADQASFYKPTFFTDFNGNFTLRGSSASTDFFELESAGSNNNGQFQFTIGDDGDEPIIFYRDRYDRTPRLREMLRM
ncbi:hypothetical protein CHRY9390_02439 [Chryseobacterium aquaeductus]|uniref:Uncharacterized protein n=1 Tax=Chryseobacterium aquaeductus TaxID=2675056 RepID=A0A9N8MHX2_9FLAO|nr:hypothetical protein [Chryseobacterium aquaeductus]CAA7331725.1 hypothetical protein CHRY9390_02439 [Chryseobacterium potabilaquae]CAD7811936.1 hypothetical protein CHRY9390_02439 [Chryseobacterium aquaeductus]